jgi:hypothetical protein
MSIEPRLESLLEETVDDVVCREGSVFDEMAGRFGK